MLIHMVTRAELLRLLNCSNAHSYNLHQKWLSRPVKSTGRAHLFDLVIAMKEFAKALDQPEPDEVQIQKTWEFIYRSRCEAFAARRIKKLIKSVQ